MVIAATSQGSGSQGAGFSGVTTADAAAAAAAAGNSCTQGSCSGNSTWSSQGLQLACSMCVCVVGGGNIAAAAAAWLSRSSKSLCVHVLTRQPQRWSQRLRVRANPACRWAALQPYECNINLITSDAAAAVKGASLVMVAAPAHVHLELLRKVAPHLKPGCILGTLFGQGGFDWAVEAALGPAQGQLAAVFGLQHVPWLARWEEYGRAVELIGPKEFICAAVSPPCARPMVQLLLQLCFDQPCKLLPNFLCLTLTPSNQIIHPARYYSIFKDWDGEKVYKENEISWGLYTEFDAEAAKHLALLDGELQAIKKALVSRFPNLDLSTVLPIQERILQQYGDDVRDRTNLQTIVATNGGYASCRTPAAAVEGGFQPNLQSRLFQEDVPSGLCVLRGIAELAGVQTPEIDLMIEWHQKFMKVPFLKNKKLNQETLQLTTAPQRYGISTLGHLVATTLRGCGAAAHSAS